MMAVLKVTDLKKTFEGTLTEKSHQVLNGVTFEVPRGSVTGFLGINGAGKTTCLKCILGFIHADSGTAEFFGEPLKIFNKVKIGFLPERPYFYEYLTGREFLKFYAELSGMPTSKLMEKIEALLKRVGLSHAIDKHLRDYSKGMLQRVGIAQALIHDPELVILDEPMTGLDPDGRYEVGEMIRDLGKSGVTVFFSTHLLNDVESLCDRVVILSRGQVAYSGATQDFIQNYAQGKHQNLEQAFITLTKRGPT